MGEREQAARRGAGEGTVKQLPSGRWRVRVPTAEGKRIGGVFDTEAEAEGVRRALVAQVAAAGAAPTGSTTLGAWGRRWLAQRERDGIAGARNERSLWTNRVAPHTIANLPLAAITRAHVAEWIEAQRTSTVKRRTTKGRVIDTGAAPKADSLARFKAILHNALQHAVELGLIPGNPARGVKVFGASRGKRTRAFWTYLSREEIRAVLTCDQIPVRFRLLYQVAIYTGLRRGELWALRWSDVTLDGPQPEVHVQRSHDGPTKTGLDRRVPLLPPARAALRRLRELAGRPAADALVFPTSKGRMRNRNDRGQWGRNGAHPGYKVRAGITRKVPFHALRHTCATALISGFWGPAWRLEDVQKFLGHTSIKVTERYAHLSPEYLHARTAGTATGADAPDATTALAAALEAVAPTPDGSAAVTRGSEGARVTARKPRENARESDAPSISTRTEAAEPTPRDRESSSGRVLRVSRETPAEGPATPPDVSCALAEAIVRGVEQGTPTAPLIAALVALVLASPDHPLRARAEAVASAGPHRVRRALDLADAVLELASASRASTDDTRDAARRPA